jgi:uncharacterized tellurite resistance protein B-like protein
MGNLAKVIAAAGWADKRLSSDEIENLKDLLFQFQRSVIDPREDAMFEMYMKSPLESTWGLSREAAAFVMQCAIADVSRDFDYLRMTREFTELTSPAERNQLLELLFAVANADGHVSREEHLEIKYMADYFLLSPDRVNKAFMKATG